MSVQEYWMGKGIDLDEIWKDFDDGQGYIRKVADCDLYLLRITFNNHPINLPLFDHEVIYKTVKGTFHDVKKECFTRQAYDNAAPIFLHRVDRGSGIFEFLAQFDPLSTWVVALGSAAMWYRSALQKDQKFDEDRLDFIRKNFPNACTSDVQAYMKAWTTFGRRRVLHRLIGQGLARVEISQDPHKATESHSSPIMVNMATIVAITPPQNDKPVT